MKPRSRPRDPHQLQRCLAAESEALLSSLVGDEEEGGSCFVGMTGIIESHAPILGGIKAFQKIC